MKRLPRLLVAFALLSGFAVITIPLATAASASNGITYYVNSETDTGAADCTTPTNTDCGIDDAIAAFDADTVPNDADSIVFVSTVSSFISTGSVIQNTASGVTLTVDGNGATSTAVTADNLNPVFQIQDAMVNMSGLTITNGLNGTGGGIENGGTLTVTNVTLTQNFASLGGAIFNNGTATLNKDTFLANGAAGGAGVFNNGTVTITNDTFWDGNATIGAGVDNATGTATLTNDTLSGGTSGQGGGVSNDGAMFLTNDTLSNNSATVDGADIYSDGAVTTANSIFDSGGCHITGTFNDLGYNVESDSSCGAALSDVVNSSSIDLATSLATNGSSGPETLAIGPGSSAFEEVPEIYCVTTTDERGLARPGISGAACDAGAYEYHTPPPPTRLSQVIEFASPGNVTFGTVPITLSATATSNLPVSFASESPGVCTASESTLQLLAVGTCEVVASQGGDSVYSAANNVTETFNVSASVAAAKVPGRAHIRRFQLSSKRVVLDVTAPANGGSRLTSYQYSINGSAWVNTALGGRVFVHGLKARRTYALRVRARNAIGPGLPSNTVRAKTP
jgi:hypothetical protein